MKVMDRLQLAMLCDVSGALLRVQPLNKIEAQELARQEGVDLVSQKPWSSDKITSALGIPPLEDPVARQNEPILVCDVLGYNHVRFFLVERIANASGVTSDGEVILQEDGIDDDGVDPFEGSDDG